MESKYKKKINFFIYIPYINYYCQLDISSLWVKFVYYASFYEVHTKYQNHLLLHFSSPLILPLHNTPDDHYSFL